MKQKSALIQNLDKKIREDIVLFFDMDGTLVHTNHANFLAYEKAIKAVTKVNYNLVYNKIKRFNRSSLKETIPNLSEIEYEKIVQKKEEYFNDFLDRTKLNEYLLEIINKYSKTNRIVLVTNCRKDRAMVILKHYELVDKFNNIFCRQLTDKFEKINKFQNAISTLDISPESVIVFENEQHEIDDAIEIGVPENNIIIF